MVLNSYLWYQKWKRHVMIFIEPSIAFCCNECGSSMGTQFNSCRMLGGEQQVASYLLEYSQPFSVGFETTVLSDLSIRLTCSVSRCYLQALPCMDKLNVYEKIF
ncbi:hypothetical protein AVEN_265451-1 [Araneus ventricosus]|uniref:Uncharacterized protein n=1 Tax=Araneus ventricosus TaxID=182803 RepID=A0A4Y2CI30_ARAVE|nr:hypothetical protein AVEN_265451-1 [Araneus ventricosus]